MSTSFRRAVTAPTACGRHASLDGLRGLAALVVVTHHAMLTSPVLGRVFYGDLALDQGTGAWWWVHSPLHLLWAGSEAVTVFFVLSGFVLVLPFLREPGRPSWRAYYPQRLLRLYLPVLGSLLLAAVTYAVVDHRSRPGMSPWMTGHDVAITPAEAAHDAVLVLGSGELNSVLWSLRWEVLFSLALPLAVWTVVRAARWRFGLLSLAVVAVLTIAAAGLLGVNGAGYLPMFAIGATMAAGRERIGEVAARLGGGAWTAVLCIAVVVLLVRWWPGSDTDSDYTVDFAFATVGAALLLAAFLWCPAAVALGRARWAQWVGLRSFSLYLVHEPVVTSTAFLLRTDDPMIVLAVAVPVALLLAAVFFRLVERPGHRLAKWAGRRAVPVTAPG